MNIREIFSATELAQVTKKSNLQGARIVLFDWTMIIGTFYLMAQYPNPIVLLLGIFILGARQLGLGVIVHETGHRTLFESNELNDFVGNWLAGYWVFSNKDAYMKVHLQHHQEAGTEQDPDLNNYRNYPITRTSLKRKIKRDLTGQVGWKRLTSIYKAIRRFDSLDQPAQTWLRRSIAANLVMLLMLSVFGVAWLYLAWVLAFVTSHMLVTRIRQIAEHAAVPDSFDTDPRKNTRTLYINPLERLFIAPHHVNYHMEHHMAASIPIYHLELAHQILLNKGYYEGVRFERGYFNLLRQVTRAG